jgi:hypothetical protein
MDVRSAITRWAGAGAATNARASLDEWNRAQEEVSALLMRLDDPDARPAAQAPVAVGDQPRSGGGGALLVARQ